MPPKWGWITLLALALLPSQAFANGADLPPEVVLQGYLKPENDRLHLLLRVPLVLLGSFELPKRGPGYLDLMRVDDRLKLAAASTARQIELQEDGVALVPGAVKARISLPSDRSFLNYQSALDDINGSALQPDTDLFWNQGFFDVSIEYPIRSARGHFSIGVNIAPELGRRLKLRLQFLPAEGTAVQYSLPGNAESIALDPNWLQVVWLFARLGFFGGFAFDRFLLLVCLIAPFRRFRGLLALVLVWAALQALTSTVIAEGTGADNPLPVSIAGTILGAAIVLLAIGNVAAPTLRRRWFLAAIAGAACGVGPGNQLADDLQLAGGHTIVSVACFDCGLVLAQVTGLIVALAAVRLLFTRTLGPPVGLLVLSLILGHIGWHWMVDNGHELVHHVEHAGVLAALRLAAPWLLPAIGVGALVALLLRRTAAEPVPLMLTAILGRGEFR